MVPRPAASGFYGFTPVGRGVPVVTPSRRRVTVTEAVRTIGKLERMSREVRGLPLLPVHPRTRAPLRGLARGPGIGRVEALTHLSTALSWTWAPLFSLAIVGNKLAGMSIGDLLPGAKFLPGFIADTLGPGVRPWMWAGWGGPIRGDF